MAVLESYGDAATYWQTPRGGNDPTARDWLSDILGLVRDCDFASGRVFVSPDAYQAYMHLWSGDNRLGRFVLEADHIGPTHRIERA